MDVADLDSWLTLAAIRGPAQVLWDRAAALSALLSYMTPGPFPSGGHGSLVHPDSQLGPSYALLQHQGRAGANAPWLP